MLGRVIPTEGPSEIAWLALLGRRLIGSQRGRDCRRPAILLEVGPAGRGTGAAPRIQVQGGFPACHATCAPLSTREATSLPVMPTCGTGGLRGRKTFLHMILQVLRTLTTSRSRSRPERSFENLSLSQQPHQITHSLLCKKRHYELDKQ